MTRRDEEFVFVKLRSPEELNIFQITEFNSNNLLRDDFCNEKYDQGAREGNGAARKVDTTSYKDTMERNWTRNKKRKLNK